MSLYSLTPDSDDALPGEGTLQIAVPHWSARVRVRDDRQQIVVGDDAIASRDDASGPFDATFSLPPGIYQVEIALGDQAVRELVPIHPGHTTRFAPMEVADGTPLQFLSTAPLLGAVNSPRRHQQAAQKWSQEITWPASPGGESQLFLFVRTLGVDPAPGFAGGLKLLDATGRLVTDFADGARRNTGQGWWAFNADLPPGAYILRRGGRNVSLRFQPLYLAAGWQTQAFLLAERYPRLHSLSLNMAPRGVGFQAGDASAIAADVLLDGLSNEAGVDFVLGARITSLLSQDLDNPWLAIVAAHALQAAQTLLARPGSEPSFTNVEATLAHLLSILEPLRDHPDVAALLLAADRPAPSSFWSPPTLRASLRRINEHAIRFADTVPEDSLTDLILDDVLINSPWTAWHTLARMPVSAPAAGAGQGQGRSLLKVRKEEASLDDTLSQYGATLARAAAPSAPVFYLANAARDADWQVASLVPAVLADAGANAAGEDDAKAQVAQAMIRPSPTAAMPEAITVDVEGQVTRLLAGAEPALISSNLNVPLARTEQSLYRLQATPADDAPGDVPGASGNEPLRPVAPDVFDAIVAQTLGPIARELSGPAAATGSGPRERPSFIEESVPKLLDESERLIAGANRLPTGAQQYAERARTAGEALHHVADDLLAAAGYTVLTDPQGRIVFGNGAFRIFLMHAADLTGGKGKQMSRAEREAAGQRAWEAALKAMPLGTSTVPVPAAFTHHAGDDWRLQRTAVRDDRSGDLRAYLNLLHNPRGTRITGAILRDIARLLPRLTQAVLLFVDGSVDERDENLAEIEEAVSQLEQIVGHQHA